MTPELNFNTKKTDRQKFCLIHQSEKKEKEKKPEGNPTPGKPPSLNTEEV